MPLKRTLGRLGLAACSTLASLVLAEGVVRHVDGWELTSARLQRQPMAWTVPALAPIGDTGRGLVEEFQRGRGAPEGVDPSWILDEPPSLPPAFKGEDLQQREDDFGWQVNYVFNDLYVGEVHRYPDPPPELRTLLEPDWLWLFSPAWGSAHPRFRYPASTVATPLTRTNRFGWRGPDLDLDKPPGTVRIACVGASTTASPTLRFSYPELLQHWLTRWADAQGLDVRFEVINVGREGIRSPDMAAIVRYELLPVEPDYVVFYEGANDFGVPSVVHMLEEASRPPGALDTTAEVPPATLPVPARWSAVAMRLVQLRDARGGLAEQPHPAQEFVLPPGLDEIDPDPAAVGEALGLGKVLADLEQMAGDVQGAGGSLVVCSFAMMVHDGLRLDPDRHAGLYQDLHSRYWPYSYANLRRASDLRNRVLLAWAAQQGAAAVDVAGAMPGWPELYHDVVHNSEAGIRVRAWIVFEELLPVLQADLASGRLPAPDREALDSHPFLTDPYVWHRNAERPPGAAE